MANRSPEEIADAAALIFESVEGSGVVITDKRFAQSNKELSLLLKSEADDDQWRGWILTFVGIPQQLEVGGQWVDVTYRFFAKFYHFYENDFKDGITSDLSFKRILIATNEKLNSNRRLKLEDDQAIHQMLQSQGDFELEDIGGGSVNQFCHTAEFLFDVIVTSAYIQEGE
jgi:hypothetical protein